MGLNEEKELDRGREGGWIGGGWVGLFAWWSQHGRACAWV